MPFVSQAQQRFAFGTDQPWAKKWADMTDFKGLPEHVGGKKKAGKKKSETEEAVSGTTTGQLFRSRPIVARFGDPKAEPRLEEKVLNQKQRDRSETLPGGRYPMPDKQHAANALARIDQGGLSPEEKKKVRVRAHKILGEHRAIAVRKREADRGGDGKFKNGAHTTAAREHILAASIAIHSNDQAEAKRRLDSAQIHASHSQHAKAKDAITKIQAARENLKNPAIAQGHLDTAYGSLDGEPNRLLQMKKTRESDTDRTRFRETLSFYPKFIESSFNAAKGTVDVVIIDQGMGNSRDGHNYLPNTIREAVQSGVFEGEQSYADHPSKFDDQNRPERSIRDLIGYYYNSREVKTANGVGYGATLKIQEGQDWVVGLIKEAINYQKRFPDRNYVGISINADGDTVPTQRDGKTVNDVVKITEAFSADVVTKPARGGKFLKLTENIHGHKETALDQKKILEAAAQLEAMAGGTEVDAAQLTALAATMREEAASGKDTDKTDKSAQLEKSGDGKDKVGTNQMEAEPDGKGKDEKDGKDGKKDGKGDEEDEPDELRERRKKEAEAAAANGKLTEAQRLQAEYPSIWTGALAEAKRQLAADKPKLEDVLQENARLRADNLIRESVALANKKLKESKLPEGSFADILTDLIGLTETEMVARISAREKFLESVGYDFETKRTTGAGEKIALRESSDTSLTGELLAGVVKE